MGAIMKLREIFEGAGSAVLNGIEDLIKLGGRAGAKSAEKEVGAIAKPETKVVAQTTKCNGIILILYHERYHPRCI